MWVEVYRTNSTPSVEYKILLGEIQDVEAMMNKYASEGWRLSQMSSAGTHHCKITVVMERPT